MSDKKLDHWNAPFDLNRDGKMAPEEKALKDYTIMNTFFSDDDKESSGGGGRGTGCIVPFFVIGGITASMSLVAISAVIEIVKGILT